MDVQIEKGIPIGKSFRKEPDNEWRDTLLKMDIGDSFVIDELQIQASETAAGGEFYVHKSENRKEGDV